MLLCRNHPQRVGVHGHSLEPVVTEDRRDDHSGEPFPEAQDQVARPRCQLLSVRNPVQEPLELRAESLDRVDGGVVFAQELREQTQVLSPEFADV